MILESETVKEGRKWPKVRHVLCNQHCPIKLFCVDGNILSVLSDTAAISHMELLSTLNVANETEELNFNLIKKFLIFTLF